MKIALHSDLHLEGGSLHPDFLSNSDFDVLALAGDIVNGCTVGKLESIRAKTDKPIILVPGNHEYYRGGTYDETNQRLEAACRTFDIILANNKIVRIGGVHFVCSTGWSTLKSFERFPLDEKKRDVKNGVADFRLIESHSIDRMIEYGERDERFIRNSLECLRDLDTGPVVVVTHFAPTENHGNDWFPDSTISSYFQNSLHDVMYEYEPDLWLYGHTHFRKNDVDVYRTKVYSNQHGYGYECAHSYNPNFIIEV